MIPRSTTFVAIAAVAAFELGGCAVSPRTVQTYDAECQTYQRSATLTARPLQGLDGSCMRQPGLCVPMLVTAGVVTAATTVISGSVVIVGNVVYWLERQAGCKTPPAEPAPQPPQASSAPAAV